MQELVHTTGMILRTDPFGEYDRKVVILTNNHGKITAFAKGARRQTNRLVAKTDYFCFGEFHLYPGRNSYTLEDANIQNYFKEISEDFNSTFYGMYFLEVMDFLTKENDDEKEMLKLLYLSMKALIHPAYENELVKTIFELKAMALSGEYEPTPLWNPKPGYKEGTVYAEDFILYQPVEKIYTFQLKPEILKELKDLAARQKKKLWNHEFKSEEMLKL